MDQNIKKRVFRNENRLNVFINVIILLLIGTIMFALLPGIAFVGRKMALAVAVLQGGMVLGFMHVLEKYSIMVSGRSEKVLINILSCIYSLVIMVLALLLLFRGKGMLCSCVAAVVQLAALTAADIAMEVYFTNSRKYRKPSLLILGADEINFSRMKRIKYGVVAKFDSWYESIRVAKEKSSEEFAEWVSRFDAVCLLDHLDTADYTRFVNAVMEQNKDLFIVPDMINVGMTNSQLVRFDDVLTLYMPGKELTTLQHAAKRLVDIVVSFVGLVVALIPMLIVAIAIKLSSPGPVLYKQTRLTRDKKEFEIYKFRTMIPDAEKFSGPKFAEKNDPRITPIGKILRSYRLDELPQIFNILKGDMSVVGPRPERPVFVSQFEQQIENYDYRFAVKAGLTSLSHVYGRYSTYIHDRTYYDLFYVTHYSFLLDLKIMLLTSKTMFIKSAAEGEDDFKEKTVAEKTSA